MGDLWTTTDNRLTCQSCNKKMLKGKKYISFGYSAGKWGSKEYKICQDCIYERVYEIGIKDYEEWKRNKLIENI